MKRKDVEEKKQNLEFFYNYIDISKIKILQILNEEIASLNLLRAQKGENHFLLNKISKKLFSSDSSIYHELKNEKDRKELFILVDPKKIDTFSKALLRKIKQTMKTRIRPNIDFVITVGNHVNLLAQELELNIIDHYDFDLFNKIDEFANKIGALTDIGLKNKIFNYVSLLIAQSDTRSGGALVQQRILPFNTKSIKMWNGNNKDEDGFPIVSETNSIEINSFAKSLREINFKKTIWLPNINIFYDQFVKAIFKQEIFELKSISIIEDLKIELQILDEKKRKLEEQKIDLLLKWNRARKDEATLQSSLLFSAFRVKKRLEDEESIAHLLNYKKERSK